jgi:hypothetical protein
MGNCKRHRTLTLLSHRYCLGSDCRRQAPALRCHWSDIQIRFAHLEESANIHTAAAFLKALVEAVPNKVHTFLTDNGIQFCDLPSRRNGPTARLRMHMFDRTCRTHGIEPRLTKPNHPWANGQVERMNRTIKEAAVKRYHYDSRDQLTRHLTDFLAAYISAAA